MTYEFGSNLEAPAHLKLARTEAGASNTMDAESVNARLKPVLASRDGAASVIDFWRDAGPAHWFAKQPEFDLLFRERFLALHETAARGGLKAWRESAEGSLALLLLLDQYPRNSFRGTTRMYATDTLALGIADAAIEAGHDMATEAPLRLFVYLPFSHSERLSDQDRAVALCQHLGHPHIAHAEGHRDIILRFGRFPHRNPILGRTMTAEEQAFLDEGGFPG
jgi:uncharacterized protein (DUF924 family)